MKKKILGGIALLMIAALAAVNVNLDTKSNDLSSISLSNVEALAVEDNAGCPFSEKSTCTTVSQSTNSSGQKCETKTTTVSCSGQGSMCCTSSTSTSTKCS